jgi:hypothetical protein
MPVSKARLRRVEAKAKAAQAAEAQRACAAWAEQFLAACREGNALLVDFAEATVDPDLVVPLLRAITSGGDEPDVFDEWLALPFAPWAQFPPGFRFPRKLIETLLAPADTLRMGHSCERCGLRVPLYAFGNGGDVPAFPRCPSCGGKTTEAANHATDPVPLTVEDVK